MILRLTLEGSTTMWTRRRTWAIATPAAMLLCLPVAAGAATARLDGGVLRIEGAPGEVDRIQLAAAGSNEQGPTMRVDGTDPGPGCIQLANDAGCPVNQIVSIVATLGDRDDTFDGGSFAMPMRVEGGDGDDELEGGDGADELLGGPGDDELHPGSRTGGSAVVNVLDGGTGDDLFLLSSSRRDGEDVIGGAGRDTATYQDSGTPVIADLDGIADDGDPNAGGTGVSEGDNLRPDLEVIRGSRGNDVITGSDLPDELDGRDGDDDLLGLGGDDDLAGGPGRDRLVGSTGNDTLLLVDGAADRCSTAAPNAPPGTDLVDADLADSQLICLRLPLLPVVPIRIVFRPVDEPAAVVIANRRVLVRKNGAVGGRLDCPPTTRGGCKGVVRVSGRRGTPVLARSKPYVLRKGRSATILVRPRPGRVGALRALRFARVSAVEQGPSRVGPRTTLAFLPVTRR
jgi:hypothetical protein